MSRNLKKITVASFCILLAACGGGGGGDEDPADSNGNTSQNGNDNGTGNNTGSGSTDGSGDNPGSSPAFAVDESARFNGPDSIAVDNAGNLYVTDTNTPAIRKIAASGEVSTLSSSYRPGSLAVDSAGNLFILSYNPEPDAETRDGMELHKLTPQGNRTLIKRFQFEPGSYNPFSITVDGTGRIYVLSNYRNIFTVSRIDSDGSSQSVFEYGLPTGLLPMFASDPQGNLAILAVDEVRQDAGGNIIYVDRLIIVPQASHPARIDSAGVTFRALQKGTGGNMVFDANGDVYIGDPVVSAGAVTALRILKIAPDGSATEIFNGFPDGSTAQRPITDSYGGIFGLAGSANGDFYLTDSYVHAIYKITASGQASLVSGKPGESGSSD